MNLLTRNAFTFIRNVSSPLFKTSIPTQLSAINKPMLLNSHQLALKCSPMMMHTVSNTILTSNILNGTSFEIIPNRTNIRCHFPRPNERMRIKKHGYKKRLSTRGGLRILLRRILKGRHVISH